MNALELHVVSFSPVQGCWHVESLADHVQSNTRNLSEGTLGDTAYCAVGLVEDREAAHGLIKKMQAALRRGKAKQRAVEATAKRKAAAMSMMRQRARLMRDASKRKLKSNSGWRQPREGRKHAHEA